MDKIPFILFLYADTDGRKVYKADFPEEFIRNFENKNDVTEIGPFFVLGFKQKVNSIDDALKICKG